MKSVSDEGYRSPVRSSAFSQSTGQIRAQMAELGMRWTPGMAALLLVLEKGGFALTHEQIFFEIAHAQPSNAALSINRVTVYRLLERLETLGCVAKTIGSDRLSRFRLKTPLKNLGKTGFNEKIPAGQGYFECLHCHTVEPLGPASLPANVRKWLDHAAPNGQAVTEMMLRGTCGDCTSAHP